MTTIFHFNRSSGTESKQNVEKNERDCVTSIRTCNSKTMKRYNKVK